MAHEKLRDEEIDGGRQGGRVLSSNDPGGMEGKALSIGFCWAVGTDSC